MGDIEQAHGAAKPFGYVVQNTAGGMGWGKVDQLAGAHNNLIAADRRCSDDSDVCAKYINLAQ